MGKPERDFDFEGEWARATWRQTQAARREREELLALALEWARDAPLADRHRFTEFAHMVEQDFVDIFDVAEEAVLKALRSNNFEEAMLVMRELGIKAIARGQAVIATVRQGGHIGIHDCERISPLSLRGERGK
jgi:hypothetical protein